MSTPRSSMVGNTLPPVPGTRDDFEEATTPKLDYRPTIRPTLQYELYNPSDKPMSFSKAGEDFYLPARDKRWRGKDPSTGQTITYPKPGVLPIWGIPEQKITALQVVEAAVGLDGISGMVGANGARVLIDGRDEEVMEDARAGWLRKQLADWTTTTQNHERAVRKAQEQGEPPPHPPKLVKEAYEGLAKYSNEADGYLQVRCETCNWGFPDETAKWQHVIALHKDRRQEAEAALNLGRTESTIEEVQRPPATPVPTMSAEDIAEATRLINSGHSDDVGSDKEEPRQAAKPKK